MDLVIVDYGMGNLRSVQKAFESRGHSAVVSGVPADILAAKAVVLPGVGAFGRAMENLESSGLASAVKEAVAKGTPTLGICLGLQLLFDVSEEKFQQGELPTGLSLVPGTVRKFRPGLKVPQIGWNQLHMANPSPLFEGIEDGAFVYFVHSFYVDPEDDSVVSTWTDYGQRFASSVTVDNLMAIQFHPEKSSTVGLKILDNFAKFAENGGE